MYPIKKLFKFNLKEKSDFIEIGGGQGDLALSLIKKGFNFVLFIEPDVEKFQIASRKLENIECLNIDLSELDCSKINSQSSEVTIIMQDVIEHIESKSQKEFFDRLCEKYDFINLIGRTPNLKSPFGLRNSFGDNSHIYRFTDNSLKDFLIDLGFSNIVITNEPYKITGFTSFFRYLPYLFSIYIFSISFSFVYGKWEGFLTPNIVFYSENFNFIIISKMINSFSINKKNIFFQRINAIKSSITSYSISSVLDIVTILMISSIFNRLSEKVLMIRFLFIFLEHF